MHFLPFSKLLVEGLRVLLVLTFLLLFIIISAPKVKIILLQWLRHVNEDASESWINFCLQVRDEHGVHFLKELAAHVLGVLLEPFEFEVLRHVRAFL